MLSLFPVHRPCVGVAVGSSSLRLMAIRRIPFRQATVSRIGHRALEDGTIALSASAPNIVRLDVVQQELRALVKPVSDRTVALTLPDECATMGLFTVDTLAADHQERERVIRWRFQQEADVKLGPERLVYRVFPGDKSVSVLAAAINESVFKQYLALLDAACLLPVSIGFETFQVFDAFRPSMEVGHERFFVHYNGHSLTFLAFLNGQPVFLRKRRVKPHSAAVCDELIVTLQYFDDRFFRVKTDEHASKLYFVDTSPNVSSTDRPFESPTSLSIPAVHRARSVDVVPLNWTALRLNRGKAEVTPAWLPVAAGIGIA